MIFNLFTVACSDYNFGAQWPNEIQVKKTKLYLLKVPPRTSSPSSCISGTACLISSEISLIVKAATIAQNLLEFSVARSEELEVNQWIVQDIHWLSS